MKRLLMALAFVGGLALMARADYYDFEHYQIVPDTTNIKNDIRFRGSFKLYSDTTTADFDSISPIITFDPYTETVTVPKLVSISTSTFINVGDKIGFDGDADQNDYVTANIDGIVDWYIEGTNVLRMFPSVVHVGASSDLGLAQGQELIFDVDTNDNDYISATVDGKLYFYANGNPTFVIDGDSLDISSNSDINIASTRKVYFDGTGHTIYTYSPTTNKYTIAVNSGDKLSIDTDSVDLASTVDLRLDAGKRLYFAPTVYGYEGVTGKLYISAGGNTSVVIDANSLKMDSSSDIYLASGRRLYYSNNSFAEESSSGILQTYVNNASYIYIHQGNDWVALNGQVRPYDDDTPGEVLGSTSYYWHGLWYGSGGLNVKPCFIDLKKDVTIRNPSGLYDTLPKYGDFRFITDESTAPIKTGFIIDDTVVNADAYDYIVVDSSGTPNMKVDMIVAQLSACVRDLHTRLTQQSQLIQAQSELITDLYDIIGSTITVSLDEHEVIISSNTARIEALEQQ